MDCFYNLSTFTKMIKNSYKVLGVMSGTSLDGVDIAECYFDSVKESDGSASRWTYRIGVAETIPYSKDWQLRLKEAVHFSKGRLQTLNEEYTVLLGGMIAHFITKHDLNDLIAVCSHGHTVLHQPDRGITFQIGNLSTISEVTQQTVVCDFRVKDVENGGQGAPLVPIGDRLLFSEYDYCLNLGGFANCSFEQDGRRLAYDICPVNIVMNPLAESLGFPFDDCGNIAASGCLDTSLLDQLNALAFYSQSAPKSLGLEWVQKNVFPLLDASEISAEDKLHTFVEHVAQQLSQQFKLHSKVFVTGGGAYNSYLLDRVRFYTELELIVPGPTLLEYKEALVFGLLGVLRLRGEANSLSSVTGAREDVCGGVIFTAV